ncbi:hypothetical protein [Haliangium sp. UPWRP_2]|uniref:hypothetical protein n=1 Tax=Haliangium sp. UPWRP_2 TaxID=1931276 RepID=UPI0011B205AC|nr:hypothetical protein [Haliangium sp. UPWRP_2]HNN91327.1 hypothetical protein [Pseudomonadota bacterium]
MRSSTLSRIHLVFVLVGLLAGAAPVGAAPSQGDSSTLSSSSSVSVTGNDQGTKGTGSAG